MAAHKNKLIQFTRFCTVGAGNTAVDFTVFFLLNLGGVSYLLAQILSYSAGVINSFIFNRKWTFRVTGRINMLEVSRFIIVNGISLLVSSGLLYLAHDIYNQNLWVGKILATGAGIIINYVGSRMWVFTSSPTVHGDAS